LTFIVVPAFFKFFSRLLGTVPRAPYLSFLPLIHSGIPWHSDIYQEHCLFVLVNDCNVRSSVFNHMVRLYVYIPEDFHILHLYDWFSSVLVPLL